MVDRPVDACPGAIANTHIPSMAAIGPAEPIQQNWDPYFEEMGPTNWLECTDGTVIDVPAQNALKPRGSQSDLPAGQPLRPILDRLVSWALPFGLMQFRSRRPSSHHATPGQEPPLGGASDCK